MLLQAVAANPDSIIEQVFRINPTNVLGVLFVMLLAIIAYQWKENKQLKEDIKTLNDEMRKQEQASVNAQEIEIIEKMKNLIRDK